LTLLVGCRAATSSVSWQSTVRRDHPLVGTIWDVAGRRRVDERLLTDAIAGARDVLLGEKHDNPDHHALQARMVRALTARGRRPTVAFEMFTPSQARALARHLSAHPGDVAGVAEAVNWKASGWPAWEMYEPIVRAALDAGLAVAAANLDDADVRAASRRGVAALDATFVQRHGLDRPLAEDVGKAMAEEIREAHCGHAPDDRVAAMIVVQRARDAAMAEAMLTAPQRDGVVLIAGDGHVRNDRGVPAYLRRNGPAARTVSVAFFEVSGRLTTPEGYAEPFGGRLPFDYVWFTPAVDDEDPCETFRKSLERLKRN
jgi:uncharacterized iron-regulated protein